MASKMLNEAARASAAGEIDFDADTYYARLLLTNTTVDTEQAGITTVAGYTTLDEHGTAGTKPLALQWGRSCSERKTTLVESVCLTRKDA